MKKKELKKVLKAQPTLKYSTLRNQIEYHQKKLSESSKYFLEADIDNHVDFYAARYHLHQLEKLFKKSNLKAVQKVV